MSESYGNIKEAEEIPSSVVASEYSRDGETVEEIHSAMGSANYNTEEHRIDDEPHFTTQAASYEEERWNQLAIKKEDTAEDVNDSIIEHPDGDNNTETEVEERSADTTLLYKPETFISPVTNRPVERGNVLSGVKELKFLCKVCGLKLGDINSAISHMSGKYHLVNKSNPQYSCKDCFLRFSTERQVKDHMYGRKHKRNVQRKYGYEKRNNRGASKRSGGPSLSGNYNQAAPSRNHPTQHFNLSFQQRRNNFTPRNQFSGSLLGNSSMQPRPMMQNTSNDINDYVGPSGLPAFQSGNNYGSFGASANTPAYTSTMTYDKYYTNY